MVLTKLITFYGFSPPVPGQTIVFAKRVKPSEDLDTHMTLTMVDRSTILSPLA